MDLQRPWPQTDPDAEAHDATLDQALEGIAHDAALVVPHDGEVDGVVAALILQRALQLLGFTDVALVHVDAFDPAAMPTPPPTRRVIDAATLYTGPTSPTLEQVSHAYSTWEACAALADVDPLAWLACLGGRDIEAPAAPFEFMRDTQRLVTGKYLRQARLLIHTAQYGSQFSPAGLARALLSHRDPRQLMQGIGPDAAALHGAAREVNDALALLAGCVPAPCGRVALLQLASPTPLQRLLARRWQARLPDHVLVVANDDPTSADVGLAVRSHTGMRPIDFLRCLALPPELVWHPEVDGHGLRGRCPRAVWPAARAVLGF